VQLGPVKTTWLVLSNPDPNRSKPGGSPCTSGLDCTLVNCGPPPDEPDTVTVTAFEAVPLEPFCTVTVYVPADAKTTEPLNCVVVFVDSNKFDMLPPVKLTDAVAGSKPEPVIVNVNACPATAVVGSIELICGVPALDTVSGTELEAVPADPFLTVTAYVPAVSVTEPVNCVAVLLESDRFEADPPLKFTMTVAGSNPVPLIVNEKDCPATADAGLIDVIWGVPAASTVTVAAFDAVPLDPFCTVTL
jgi:hypothetical protein